MRVPYTYPEAEAIDHDYDQQVPLKVIAETVNRDFHNGNPVRTVNSIKYAINKIYNDDDWYSQLEQVWLSEDDTEGKRSE
ncbi:hypothetical protein [Alicyclobacillus dauci]|uniref:Uncharacterized protein n=1 Tax=Alicyclobacillus dauci TaxID=1475485 RepID=A0ABY6YX19_9BACL|nr:hypothetical protein [Alicyclobacillus dauci]WAH35026.1 hypothetical protein NZD86_11870 [Alicyclobacillus dauci]